MKPSSLPASGSVIHDSVSLVGGMPGVQSSGRLTSGMRSGLMETKFE